MDHVHVTFGAEGRRTLASKVGAVRCAARRIGEVGGHHVVAFCVVDEHVHLLLEGQREDLGQVVGNVHQALQFALEARLDSARWTPISDRKHLENTVAYVLRQPKKHGLPVHPADWVGSSAWDLLGARRLAGFDAQRLRAALPRWGVEDLLTVLGLGPVAPVRDVIGRDLASLRKAVARSLAVAEDLRGTSYDAAAARQAYAELGRKAGFSTSAIASHIGSSASWARSTLGSAAPSDVVVRALRQLALMDAVRGVVAEAAVGAGHPHS